VPLDPVALIEALGGTPTSGLSDAGGPSGWVTIDSVAGPWTIVSAAGGWVARVKTADLRYLGTRSAK